MELYQLKTFIEVAQTGNLTEAAAQLNISQPAASAHLKALEKEVGFSLFHRTSKGMILTEKGSHLLLEAQQIDSRIESFYRKAAELQVKSAEPIRIGLNTDSKLLRVNELIGHISAHLPQVELHFINTKSEDFIQDLNDSKISAGYYYGCAAMPSVYSVKLRSFRMVVVYPKSWDVPGEGVSLEYFAQKPWIWTTQGCPFYRQSIDYFTHQGMIPQRIMYVDDESLIGDLVQEEVGCSLLAEPAALRFAGENSVQLWTGLDLHIHLYFGYPKEKRNDPVLLQIGSIVNRIWKEIL
ncbi:LysR family transcriptional regulator [Paenibacillus chartarius]|uniref:LysR family transcriptional regulator n=1 Tax=Paenibacillus chartarius TaxID=747481 RepID=A0ABV6DGX6_9BACL